MNKFAAAFGVAMVILSGCGQSPENQPQSKTPDAANVGVAPLAKSDEQLINEFIEKTYAGWREDREGWQREEGRFIYEQCGTLRVKTATGSRRLLAMCGTTEESPASMGELGVVDLYVLKPAKDSQSLEPILQKKEIASGMHGNPGKVSILQLGPHLFGFVIDAYYSSDGRTMEVRSIYLPHADKLVEAAPHINLSLDNEGVDGKDSDEYYERKFAITPDTGSTDEVYPLKVTETGKLGKRSLHKVYTVQFDSVSGNYLVPKALSEGNL